MARYKAHRDRVNKKVMTDPRMQPTEENEGMFDMKRASIGGFEVLVQAKKAR